MDSFVKYGLKPFGAIPNERQFAHFHYKKAFFHFGVNTFTDLEWGDGTEDERVFDPTDCDVRSWVRDVKAAGFDLAVLTAKHHDGFCLWPTATTEHSIKKSPYKNGKGDIVREFTDACREYGVRAGLYLSPWDRNCKFWATAQYDEMYMAQLRELLTQYGRIDEVWWDGAGSDKAHYDWKAWVNVVHTLQPTCCVLAPFAYCGDVAEMRCVGGETGKGHDTQHSSIDFEKTVRWNQPGRLGGQYFVPAENDLSVRPGWFYHAAQDGCVRSVVNLNKIWFESIGKNAMLHLNFPPDRRGRLHPQDVENAIRSDRCIRKMKAVNYALGATVTADSVLADCTPEKAIFDDENLFYTPAAGQRSCEIRIDLPAAETFNVLWLGEDIRLGERVTAFSLAAVGEDGECELCAGTSVGYSRAVLFEKGSYQHLILRVRGEAEPVLNRLGLHLFDGTGESEESRGASYNLADTMTSHIEQDAKVGTVHFGGVFPFNTVRVELCDGHENTPYKIFIFNGESWFLAGEGVADGWHVCHRLDKIYEAYQIRIETDGLRWKPDFDVRLEK